LTKLGTNVFLRAKEQLPNVSGIHNNRLLYILFCSTFSLARSSPNGHEQKARELVEVLERPSAVTQVGAYNLQVLLERGVVYGRGQTEM